MLRTVEIRCASRRRTSARVSGTSPRPDLVPLFGGGRGGDGQERVSAHRQGHVRGDGVGHDHRVDPL